MAGISKTEKRRRLARKTQSELATSLYERRNFAIMKKHDVQERVREAFVALVALEAETKRLTEHYKDIEPFLTEEMREHLELKTKIWTGVMDGYSQGLRDIYNAMTRGISVEQYKGEKGGAGK